MCAAHAAASQLLGACLTAVVWVQVQGGGRRRIALQLPLCAARAWSRCQLCAAGAGQADEAKALLAPAVCLRL